MNPIESPDLVADYPLSAREIIRVEALMRNGKPVVSISRWRIGIDGKKRTGQAFEFGAHRADGVAAALDQVLNALKSTP